MTIGKLTIATGLNPSPARPPSQSHAFSRTDLSVVIALLAFLAAMLFPALARTRTDSRAFQCLNNSRELNRAWRMWSDDNQDLLLYAGEDPAAASARAWVTGIMDFNPNNAANWDPQASIMRSPIWPYCGTNVNLWRCPSDQSSVVVNGEARPRVRSYSMNFYLGGWSGTDGGLGGSKYRLYLKGSDLQNPPPAQLFVFTDMRPDVVSDGTFVTAMDGYSPGNPAVYKFYEFPADYHDASAAFSYADGHGEVHRWQDRRTTPPLLVNLQIPDTYPSPRNVDIAWLQDRSTRPK